MMEIIPNWHPIFVHFTVALFSAAVSFYWLAYLAARLKLFQSTLSQEFETVARWCLWAVAIITIATVLAGWYAYNTVKHDTLSHIAMTNHRNWALVTAPSIILLALWSVWRYRYQQKISFLFLIALLIGQGLLLSTAWRGAELVFRYGLGVMSLPQINHHNHQHSTSVNTTPASPNAMPKENSLTTEPDHLQKSNTQPIAQDDHEHNHE